MAKNYFNRYIWLIELINRHGYITMPEINRAWRNSSLNEDGQDIPERTFFNHKDSIRDIFGLEIKCDRTLGYHIVNADDMNDGGIRSWLLQSLSLNNILNESADMKDRILFEPVPSSQKFLTEIVSAMRDGKVINITYQSFNHPEPHSFDAEPYCVKIFRQRWYLLAKTPKYDSPRIYALDRIVDMEEMERTFEIPEGFDASSFFSNYFGIIIGGGEKVETVRLKVRADQVKYYESLPLHSSQEVFERTEKYTVFSYRLVPTFDFWQELLSKGEAVEVLEPASLRKWMKDAAEDMQRIYDGKDIW